MRVILDTNILVSALISPGGVTDTIYRHWLSKQFILLTCEEQITELRNTLRKEELKPFVVPALAGKMINRLRGAAVLLTKLPQVDRSPDPKDNYLLSLIEAGLADYLVTGDKCHLILLERHQTASIVSARTFINLLLK